MSLSDVFSFPVPAGRAATALAAALLLAGCAVGPDYRVPELAVPAAWEGADAATAGAPLRLAEWWTRLGDPQLDALIVEAVAGNLDVATAKARIREARASYRQAGGALYPEVDGSTSATRQRSGSETRRTEVSSQFRAGFDTAWELDIFGGRGRQVEAAGYGVEAAEQELRATLVTLLGDVATNYVAARGAQARIDYARQTAASQRDTEALTRVKFEAGAASGADLANAVGQASSTEAGIPSLEADYAAAVHRLSVLTGRPPATLKARLAFENAIPAPALPLPTGVPADLLRTRPDVRLAERQLARATAEIGLAEAARYPSLSLTGSLSTSATSVGDLAESTSISWVFGPTLTLPIFNAGQLAAAVEVEEAQRDQSYVAFRAAVLTALEEVENALVAFTKERQRYQSLSAAVEAYREAARLARALYQTGASDFLEVLDAERSLYAAEDALIQSRIAITTDYIALNKALGGGWDGAIDASRPEIIDVNTGPHFIDRPQNPTL